MKTLLKSLALTLLFAAGAPGIAGEENFDLDSRFRAKLAKEKIKQTGQQRELDRAAGRLGKGLDNERCGSQNIGNIDTAGRPGTAPREIFVFAPNAINFVGPGGCR